jgi:hypothetical protein
VNSSNISISLVAVSSVVASSATGVALFYQVRLKRVRVTDTSGAEIFLEWISNNSGAITAPNSNLTAIGNSSFPSSIDSRPPADSTASMWQGSSNTVGLFNLKCAANTSYVDIWFDAAIGSGTGVITTAVANSQPVGIYYGSLDSSRASAANYKSVALDALP